MQIKDKDIVQKKELKERNCNCLICTLKDLSWYGNANQNQNAIKHIITSVLSEYWKEIMGHPYVFKIYQ